jgi:hypothetical protein
MRSNWIAVAISAAVVVAFVKSAAADEAAGCAPKVTRGTVVGCAVRASLSLRSEQQATEVLEGRRLAVSPLLPSNPTLAVSGGHRTAASGDPTTYNWYATLSQEVEVAGQRGARRDAIDAEITAQDKRAHLAKRRAALAAWLAFFEASASAEERGLAERLTVVASSMASRERGLARDSSRSSMPTWPRSTGCVSCELGSRRSAAWPRARRPWPRCSGSIPLGRSSSKAI